MKTKDIEVGQDYAYERWSSRRYSTNNQERVTVLATGVERTVGRAYYGTSSTQKNGVRVQFAKDGRIDTVPSVKIIHTWAEQEAINTQRADAKRQQEEFASATAARRAASAKRIEDVLASHGEEPREHRVHTNISEQALMAEGFPEGERGILGRFDLDDWMNKGVLAEGPVTALLTEVFG